MPKFYETEQAGRRAEQRVISILSKYTRQIYSNTKIETRYTKGGHTEVDIIASISDAILVLEIKNVSSIEGRPDDYQWHLTGLETQMGYFALNVFEQNRLHVRTLKNLWYETFNEWVTVIPAIIVPEECELDESFEDSGILRPHEFELQVAALSKDSNSNTVGYRLSSIITGNEMMIKRNRR